jgi:hypothetical protein
MKMLILSVSAAVLALAGAAPAQQPKEGFRVTLTMEYSGFSLFQTCWMDIDAGGQPEKVAGDVTAQLQCVGPRAPFTVKEPLSNAEKEQFSKLVGKSELWNGQTAGSDPRGGDGTFVRLELKSDKVWTAVVVSGNTTFQNPRFGTTGDFTLPARRDFMSLIRPIHERLEKRGLGGVSDTKLVQEQESGIDGTWALFSESGQSSRITVGLKRNGSAIIGYVLAGATTAPLTDAKVDGDTVTFTNPINGTVRFVGRLDDAQMLFTRDTTKLIGRRVQRGESGVSVETPKPPTGPR